MEGEGDKKFAREEENKDDDSEHEDGSNPGELGASRMRHTTSRRLADRVACPGKNTSRRLMRVRWETAAAMALMV